MEVTLHSPNEIGNLCKRLREAANMSQQALAEAIGAKGRQDVWNAENAEDGSRLGIQQRILAHFGKRLETLYHVSDT